MSPSAMSPSGPTSTYSVVGMTCSHCVSAVTEEVGGIPGVRDVVVDLASGRLTFTSERDVDESTVRDAVEEAGYTLASPGTP